MIFGQPSHSPLVPRSKEEAGNRLLPIGTSNGVLVAKLQNFVIVCTRAHSRCNASCIDPGEAEASGDDSLRVAGMNNIVSSMCCTAE